MDSTADQERAARNWAIRSSMRSVSRAGRNRSLRPSAPRTIGPTAAWRCRFGG